MTEQRKDGAVIQGWLQGLSFMQQSVVLSGLRGCDGIPKRHKCKPLIKWFRRCVLMSAFDGAVLEDAFSPGGGSYTGPIAEIPDNLRFNLQGQDPLYDWKCYMLQKVADDYIDSRDELPAHYTGHMMHAFEILGYKHPVEAIREYWRDLYTRAAQAHHLWPESAREMDSRLGDSMEGWTARNDRSTSCSD